jgi:hypothetical protein
MHYYALAVLPPGTTDISDELDRIMAPHQEHFVPNGRIDKYGEEDGDMAGFWDWYVIGGRWTGYLDGYEPHKDPANWEPCAFCDEPGVRYASGVHPQTGEPWCNGCSNHRQYGCPPGFRVSWGFRPHEGDVLPARTAYEILKADESKIPYTLVVAESAVSKEHRNPDWHDGLLTAEGHKDYSTYMAPTENYKQLVVGFLAHCPPDAIAVIVDYHC